MIEILSNLDYLKEGVELNIFILLIFPAPKTPFPVDKFLETDAPKVSNNIPTNLPSYFLNFMFYCFTNYIN